MILTDELCDKLCQAAKEKSQEVGIDISFAVCDENGLPRVYRRYGDALVLSITLVPGKAYTAAVTQCKTKDVAAALPKAHLLWPSRATIRELLWWPGAIRCFTTEKLRAASGSAAVRRNKTASLPSMWYPSFIP